MEYLSALLVLFLRWPVLLPILLTGGFFAFRNRRQSQALADDFFSRFRVGGHRGSPLVQPENTIASMAQAKLEGADLIEFDVSLTKDGVAVLLHDDTLDRTTNMSGAIREYLYKDLSMCNCAAKFVAAGKTAKNTTEMNNNEQSTGTVLPIPTLEELVHWAKENKMLMLFDVKDADQSLVVTLAQLFKQYDIYQSGIVCSFFPTVVYALKSQQPNILTGLTWRRWFFSYVDIEATIPRFTGARHLLATLLDTIYHWCVVTWLPSFLGVDMVLTERREISSTFVKQQALAGRRVCAWTVNDVREMHWMRDVLNIPFLSDRPALAAQIAS